MGDIAKAFALDVVLADVAETLDTPASELIGRRVDEYIASKVTVRGGGHPDPRVMRKVLAKCKDPSWYPGKPSRQEPGSKGGRPAVYSEHQKDEVARVAMDLKRQLIPPLATRYLTESTTWISISISGWDHMWPTVHMDRGPAWASALLGPWTLQGPRPAWVPDLDLMIRVLVGKEGGWQLIAPTPRREKARLPRLSRNPETDEPMSRHTVNRIFQARCYDEAEDDPWQYLHCVSQDVLPERLLPLRVNKCRHILTITTARSWYSHVAIDPCYSLLAKTDDRSDEQKISAMGQMRWRSKRSRINTNLRAPATTSTQGTGYNYHATRVDWTVAFARGKILIYCVDKDLASERADLPEKLTDSKNLAKFIRNVLPGLLEQMKHRHGWADIPRCVVHDKASYMVPPAHDRLQTHFAAALRQAGFRSWVGDECDSASWMVRKFGDVYPHETAIAHVRRLLDTDFAHTDLHEAPAQF